MGGRPVSIHRDVERHVRLGRQARPSNAVAHENPNRVLLGSVQVRTDTNVLVGQGDVVVVQSVTP
jgi:hypothetical protein